MNGHYRAVLAAQILHGALRQLPLENGECRDNGARYCPIVVLPVNSNDQIRIFVQLWVRADVLVAQQVLIEHLHARASLGVQSAAQGHADVDAAVEHGILWLLEIRVQRLRAAHRALHAVWTLRQARAVPRLRVLLVNGLLSLCDSTNEKKK